MAIGVQILASLSTRLKLSVFGLYLHLLKWSFSKIFDTRQHLPKAVFEKNVTRLAKVLSESREFGVSGHCSILMHAKGMKFYFECFQKVISMMTCFHISSPNTASYHFINSMTLTSKLSLEKKN